MQLFPVFRKELIELAAQKRTYWMRGLFTVLLCCVVGMVLKVHYDMSDDLFRLLGEGSTFFHSMIICGLIGIGFFLPILIADTLPAERERGALELLMLTRLTAFELIIEKLFSRLWPMLTMLLVGVPVAAVCYTFGGLTIDVMAASAYLVLLFLFQVGAWSMIWAVLCRSTMAAFLWSIGSAVVVIFLVPVMTTETVCPRPVALHYFIDEVNEGGLVATLAASWIGWIPVVSSIGIAWFALPFTLRQKPKKRVRGASSSDASDGPVPRDRPIAWRERHRVRAGGKITILVYALSALALGLMFAFDEPARAESDFANGLLFSVWGVAGLSMLVAGVNLVAAERTNQTLAPILTLPLDGREIMRQKLAGLFPLVFAFIVLIWGLSIGEAIHEGATDERTWGYRWSRGEYLAAAATLPVIMLPLLLHWGALVGLIAKTRLRGLMIALGALFVWTMAIPFLLVLAATGGGGGDGIETLLYLSPPVAILAAEFRQGPSGGGAFGPLLLALMWHAGLLAMIRFLCGSLADRWLGRVEPPYDEETYRDWRESRAQSAERWALDDIDRVEPVDETRRAPDSEADER